MDVDAARAPSTPASPAAARRPELAALGLAVGERVRWRNRPGGRWQEGTVIGRESDGSIGIRDGKGASRALRIDRLEVRTVGPRGAQTWESLTARAQRTEQLPLLPPANLDAERR